jgi:hypothetical protein
MGTEELKIAIRRALDDVTECLTEYPDEDPICLLEDLQTDLAPLLGADEGVNIAIRRVIDAAEFLGDDPDVPITDPIGVLEGVQEELKKLLETLDQP